MDNQFWYQVAIAVTSTIAIGLLTYIVGMKSFTNFLKAPFQLLKRKIRVYRRIKESKIVTFFYDRAVLRSDAGRVGDYIEKANEEVYLIGSWFSTTLNDENLKSAIIDKVEHGVEFSFCFSGYEDISITMYARYLNMKKERVIIAIYRSYEMLFRIKDELPEDMKRNLKIYAHNQLLPTAFWAIDPKRPKKALYKLDHRVILGEVKSAYGMEFKDSSQCAFAENIKSGYFGVLKTATELKQIPIELDNLYHDAQETLRHQ